MGCLNCLQHAAWPGSQNEHGAGKRAGAAQAWPPISWEQTGVRICLTWAHHSPDGSVIATAMSSAAPLCHCSHGVAIGGGGQGRQQLVHGGLLARLRGKEMGQEAKGVK